MTRGTRAPMPASPDFVECATCRARRRIGRFLADHWKDFVYRGGRWT